MTVIYKSRQDIAGLRKAGRIVAQTYETLRPHVKPGVSTAELNHIAEEFILSKGALPLYKGHGALRATREHPARPPFPATICTAVNSVICHGIPNSRELLEEGDIIGVDIGLRHNGWCGDACETLAVGTIDAQSQRLVDTARRCLEIGIEQARPGNHLGDIGAAIQSYAEAQGYSVVRELTGHGLGRNLWEEPYVHHYGTRGTGMEIVPGMVFTIEPMINIGGPAIKVMPDQWTIRTADGSRSAQFEHSLAITEDGVEILTLP